MTSDAFPGPDATREEIASFFASKGLTRSGHTLYIEFSGMNCNDYPAGQDEDWEPCRGWDMKSPRCDCGNRRVYWSEDEETGDKIALAD